MDVVAAENSLESAASSVTIQRMKLLVELEDSLMLIEALRGDTKTTSKVNEHFENIFTRLSADVASKESKLSSITRSVATLRSELSNLVEENRKLDAQIKIASKGLNDREQLMAAYETKFQE